MWREVYKKDGIVPDDLSSWFICRKMDDGELLITLKGEIKERSNFRDMMLNSPIFDHGFTAFRIMRRHGNLDWITFINETRREKSQTFHYGHHVTHRDEWEAENIKIILGIVDEILNVGNKEAVCLVLRRISLIRNLFIQKTMFWAGLLNGQEKRFMMRAVVMQKTITAGDMMMR